LEAAETGACFTVCSIAATVSFLSKTIEMHNILGRSLKIEEEIRWLMGYDEDNYVIFLYANCNVYSVQLKLMEAKKLYGIKFSYQIHPFTSFSTPGEKCSSLVLRL
jgi:hypothetical protein